MLATSGTVVPWWWEYKLTHHFGKLFFYKLLTLNTDILYAKYIRRRTVLLCVAKVTYMCKDAHSNKFITAQNWRPRRCPSSLGWVNTLIHSYNGIRQDNENE